MLQFITPLKNAMKLPRLIRRELSILGWKPIYSLMGQSMKARLINRINLKEKVFFTTLIWQSVTRGSGKTTSFMGWGHSSPQTIMRLCLSTNK